MNMISCKGVSRKLLAAHRGIVETQPLFQDVLP